MTDPLPETTWRELVAAATAPPPPPPEEAIAALTADSTTADRVAAMRVFIERWYEQAAEVPTAAPNAPAATLPPSISLPLRELHELTTRRKLFGQNKLVSAGDLAVEDGKIVFYVENQGGCVWAIEPDGEDPAVFVRGSSWGDPWVQEAPTLSGFLIQAVILETVHCAAFFGASTDGASVAEVRMLKRHVKPVALPAWSDKTEFLGSNGIVGFAYPDADLFHIDLAAHDREPFEAIEDMLSNWPEIGF